MALPQHILNSAALRTVTSVRVSGDGGRPYTNGAAGQLLAAAMDVRPFKDNAWSNGTFPKGFADVAGAVLTMGPVGLADRLNTTDGAVARTACTADGTLLHPARPATPIDAQYAADFPADAHVMSANYGPVSPGPQWHVIAASGAGSGAVSVVPSDLYPRPPASARLLWWRRGAAGCADGLPAAGCLSPLSDRAPLRPAVNESTGIAIFHVVPQLANGFVLLGETDKVIPVASRRLLDVVASGAGATVRLQGSPGETVELLCGTAALRVHRLTIPASGTAVFEIH